MQTLYLKKEIFVQIDMYIYKYMKKLICRFNICTDYYLLLFVLFS